ncbi:hypothetical protein [Bosea sp. (in: a-proteobacteria)]|uniref:hypothetical protein n=1 Tax=Bosea sp. (in: a-proteobacteria) TaxID=1871050 RepID=UPI00273618C5|nr:hypothetical protein [Bosea sp. (in: a-proteobacteria)]MDP3407239.1 hypothetical protein [Bosea sp. (in: a-proteobacteria)]
MSLAVMALRLAVSAALAPYVAPEDIEAATWPTLARDRVFDSRFDLLDGRGGERTPLIVFAAEAVEGNAFSAQDGASDARRGFDNSVRLVLSAQVTSRQTFETEGGDEFDAEAADLLDQELADMLAILQEQAWATLQADPLFRKVSKRITKLDAEPYPASETGEKLAVLANSYFVEPLGDGEKALAIMRDGLPSASPVRARAVLALERMQATRARLSANVLIRSGLAGQTDFAVTSIAQGAAAPVPATPAPSTPDFTVTLDPEDPLP